MPINGNNFLHTVCLRLVYVLDACRSKNRHDDVIRQLFGHKIEPVPHTSHNSAKKKSHGRPIEMRFFHFVVKSVENENCRATAELFFATRKKINECGVWVSSKALELCKRFWFCSHDKTTKVSFFFIFAWPSKCQRHKQHYNSLHFHRRSGDECASVLCVCYTLRARTTSDFVSLKEWKEIVRYGIFL